MFNRFPVFSWKTIGGEENSTEREWSNESLYLYIKLIWDISLYLYISFSG